MRKLNLKENSHVLGGEPSQRRCDRIFRRAERQAATTGGQANADRLFNKWLTICQ